MEGMGLIEVCKLCGKGIYEDHDEHTGLCVKVRGLERKVNALYEAVKRELARHEPPEADNG